MTIGQVLGLGTGFALSCYGLSAGLRGKIRARSSLAGNTAYTRRKNPRQFWLLAVLFVALGVFIMYGSLV